MVKENLFESSKYPWINPTGASELRELIGLLYYYDLYGINHHIVNTLFFAKAGPPIFSATTSRDNMKILLSILTFGNPEECKEKWPYDCFAGACPIIEMFTSNA